MVTAGLMFNNVYRNYGLLEDIVSDRGPQFIFGVWRMFFRPLGVTVSLSSGYPPQTNGQIERNIQEVLTNLLPQSSELLEPVPWLGQVCAKLPMPFCHWTHALPVPWSGE